MNPTKEITQQAEVREFDTGATRDGEGDKFDYEGFISPRVLRRYAEYMHTHRKQSDGKMRASDNWQKGIPLGVYMKSLLRHVMDLWLLGRGAMVIDPVTKHKIGREEALCAILFNTSGMLHEFLKLHGEPLRLSAPTYPTAEVVELDPEVAAVRKARRHGCEPACRQCEHVKFCSTTERKEDK